MKVERMSERHVARGTTSETLSRGGTRGAIHGSGVGGGGEGEPPLHQGGVQAAAQVMDFLFL